ncbi:MAG: ABC transporter permease, partial [Flavobacteriaceae bacterium]|nr:ABC transporter permease [Flavobacteriaceae bacterium]
MRFHYLLEKLDINSQEFHFQFQSHPNYPSALAFSDTLNFLGVGNSAYELEKEFWHELPQEFITIYKDNFALVKKNGADFSVFSEKEEKISQTELLENSKNFVLLFDKKEEQSGKKIFNDFVVFALFFISISAFSFWQFSWQETLFNVLSLAGIYISLEIFRQKFGQESPVLNNLCGSNAG